MRTTDALRDLDSHQHQILTHIDAAVAWLDQPLVVAQPGLAAARWQLVKLLQAYQIFKHVEIFDPAIRSGSPQHVDSARRMKADCIAAGEAFRAYVRRWSSTDVVAHWDAYRPAMLAMANQLQGHIARERRSVNTLLAGAQRTRRLAG